MTFLDELKMIYKYGLQNATHKESWETTYLLCKNDPNATYKVELERRQYLSDIKNLFVKKIVYEKVKMMQDNYKESL